MTIDHRYSSRTFLVLTVQSKVAGVKLLKHAPAMGQVETPSEMSERGLENALFQCKSKVGECRISYRLHFFI